MFGYVRPLSGELKVREFEDYKAVYCGLCHALGKHCGFLARFVLSYDFVFLAMLLDEGTDAEQDTTRRCAAHPLRGRKCLRCQAPVMELAAEETVILTYYKLRDDFHDEGFWKGLAARGLAAILYPAYRKARDHRPEFDRQVKECLTKLARLEREYSQRLDEVSDTFASILRAAAEGEKRQDRGRILAQIMYHLGRWIYLIDGVDDREKDRQAGRYNPISARFGEEADLTCLQTTLDNSLALMQSAFQLLERNRWSPILENILYLGLPAVQRQALSGKETAKAGK